MVMLGVSGAAHAENLLDIYQQAQIKDTQLLESKAKRDQAFEKINESRAALLPQINLGAGLNYLQNKNDTMTNTGATGSVTLDQSIYRRSNWVNLDLTEKSATQSDVAYSRVPEPDAAYRPGLLRRAQGHGYPGIRACQQDRGRASA